MKYLGRGGVKTASWAHSQSIGLGDVESNGRPTVVDESNTRSESALRSIRARKHNGHGGLLTSLPSVPGAQLT